MNPTRTHSAWRVSPATICIAIVAGALLVFSACNAADGVTVCPCATSDCDPASCGDVVSQDTRDTGMYTRVAMLSDGTLVAVSRDAARKAVAVTCFDARGRIVARHSIRGPTQQGSTAHPSGDGGWWPSVAAAPDDRLHVAWHDAAAGTLLYSQGTVAAGFGTPLVVDGDGPEIVGTHTDMALDTNGELHVVYRSETRRSLRYARRDLLGNWSTDDVPVCAGEAACPISSAEDYGSHASLALTVEAGGRVAPRIAFFDALRGDLKLAARTFAIGTAADRWSVTTLDGRNIVDDSDTGRVGPFASLAVTPARNLAAAYLDEGAGALRLLTPGAPPRSLDSGEYTTDDGRTLSAHVGQFARLRVDSAGTHHIVYLDATNLVWKYVRIEGETVTTRQTLDTLGPGGWLDFVPTSDGLVGAFGALARPGDLRIELKWFQL